MIRTECRILVDSADGRLEEAVNRFLADGWAITHVSTTAVPSEDGAIDHFITVVVERTRPVSDGDGGAE
jgi:hypothetical protein